MFMPAPTAGKLSTLRGTVLRMSSVRPLVMGMDFVCGKCGEKQYCSFIDGKFTPPERCSGERAPKTCSDGIPLEG